MNLSKPKKSKKRLIILVLLIAFLFAGCVFVKLKGVDLGFLAFGNKGMVSPVLPPGEEEKIINLLERSGLKVKEVKLMDKSFDVRLSGNLNALFSQEKDYSLQVASLQFILERSKIEGRIPVKIDLRFAKPVLIY